MPRLEQTFTVHPIGQGFFYSGEIKYDDQVKFRMVFDCGSLPMSTGIHEAQYYRSTVFDNEDILDLLVISHFDADHINHIKTLLQTNVKVKRVVMPFATFEERLFLAARYIMANDGDPGNGIVNFIIDPVGTLSKNFDDDATLYVVHSSDEPLPGDDQKNDDNIGLASGDDRRFVFDFDLEPGTGDFSLEETRDFMLPLGVNVKKVSDDKKGKLSSMSNLLMDFLFYRRNVGSANKDFFEKVRDIFYEDCKVDINVDNEEAIINKVMAKILPMTSGNDIKKIFKKAHNQIKLKESLGKKLTPKERTKRKKKRLDVSETELLNLNTTALCMLHRNLLGLFSYMGIATRRPEHLSLFRHCDLSIESIYKQPRENIRRYTARYPGIDWDTYYYSLRFRNWDKRFFTFPNVMLTSDAFLKQKEDVDAFLNKYQHYWEDFWLFQIPHHGSNNNTDRELLSRILPHRSSFINHGTTSRKHPSVAVVNDLTATGLYRLTSHVDEYKGIKFTFSIEN